jgi:hypothetical protein
VIEEALIRLTEIAFLPETVFVKGRSVLHTAAATDGQMPADQAFGAEISLGPREGSLFAAGCQLLDRRLKDIAQAPLRLDEEITAEGVACVLDDNILAALLIERADRMSARHIIREHGIEVADAQISRPVFAPAIEQSAEEFAVLLRRDREIRDLARRRIDLHAGDELHEFDAESDQEIKDLVGISHVPCVQQCQGVELDLIFLAVFNGPHHLIECPRTGVVQTVIVVKFFRAVDADTDEKLVVVQKAAPRVVEQDGIGLQGIAHFLTRSAVLFLQFHGFLVEVQSHERRLAPLPGKAGQRKAQLHIVLHQLFEHLIAHSLPTLPDLRRPAFIKTIGTIHVTIRAGRFD